MPRFGGQGRAYQQRTKISWGWSEDYWAREAMVAMLGGLHIGKQIQRVEENRIMHNRGKGKNLSSARTDLNSVRRPTSQEFPETLPTKNPSG